MFMIYCYIINLLYNDNIIIKLAKCQSNIALEAVHIDPNLYNLDREFEWEECRWEKCWKLVVFEFVTQ